MAEQRSFESVQPGQPISGEPLKSLENERRGERGEEVPVDEGAEAPTHDYMRENAVKDIDEDKKRWKKRELAEQWKKAAADKVRGVGDWFADTLSRINAVSRSGWPQEGFFEAG